MPEKSTASLTARRRLWFACFGLAVITFAAYVNSFHSGFVFDNRSLLLDDHRIQKATADNIALIFRHTYWWPQGESGLYRPVTTLSYLLNYAILGNSNHPEGYHWINLLVHTGNVLLVFFLALRLVRDFRQSFLIAAVWGVHPVLTESVTNMVGRADLLAGMTTLGGLLLYLKAADATGRQRTAWLIGLGIATIAGVFSKESAVAIVAIIALYELTWWNPARWRTFLSAIAAVLPACVALLWARVKIVGASASRFPFLDNPIGGAGFLTGRLTAVKVLAKYLELLIWPAHLSADYSYRQIPLADGRPADWAAWIVVAAVVVAAAFLFRRNKTAFFAVGFAFLTILPASNLIIPVGTIMAERFLYLPAVGFAICLVQGCYALSGRMRLRPAMPLAACLAIAAGLGARTLARNADWQSNLTLWSAAVEVSPLSFKAHEGLAQALHGEPFDLGNPMTEREIEELDRSLEILNTVPDKWNAPAFYFTVASEYLANGFRTLQNGADGKSIVPPESAAKFEKARGLLLHGLAVSEAQAQAERGGASNLKLYSRDEEHGGYLMLSETDERLGNPGEALAAARKAQTLGPLIGSGYVRAHDVLFELGRRDEALGIAMTGYLLTSDPVLKKALVKDYAYRPDEMKCAISYAALTPAVDFSCSAVKREACAVAGEAMQHAMQAGQDSATKLKRDLAAKYGCQ